MTERIDHTLRGRWTTEQAQLPPHALTWLHARIGTGAGAVTPARPPAVPDSALGDAARTALDDVVGPGHVRVDPGSRLGRAGGLSYLDLLRQRGDGDLAVPDAVVLPGTPEEVTEVLKTCVEHDVAVVPFGGGTSVVGGVTALRGDKAAVIALDLARLDRLVSVDPVSRLAVLQAGLTAPEADRLLAAHGFTLGHVPQSYERATVGGFAATRSAGQASSGYGRFEDLVEGVRLSTPVGEWRLGAAPASAAGPDLKQLVVGSEGAFGVITEVGVRLRPRPAVERYEGFFVDGWARGADVVRDLAQRRVLADVTRLSDVDESEVSLALAGGWKTTALKAYLRARGIGRPCLLVLGWHGRDRQEVRRRRRETLRGVEAVRLGTPLGEAWRHGRFNGPRQRDALLEAGVCVETLETAAHWSRLSELRTAVRGALVDALGDGCLVMCHISHAYETGASLYFTVLAARDADDPVRQWQVAKAAAGEAIAGLGTITHHHAVGTDHAPYLEGEVGALGVDVLASVKRALDPTGVLNPGKLIPGRTLAGGSPPAGLASRDDR
ncbi:FAD-binding oxidoreductase [Saccharothrix longispora]|uniref:Alkyldihydroxyacetonephosphate synthase n=1 Tax=Saccharothrix longispora TaxID=33920 RepID=A0ABU1Q4U7_9PSEU|nr:FAD-binding oxidoreductase [Saccharothrix longispora]MDR6597925.1 alkyldihydroxyacetonephosphate synthase [Saccharothrix longispora]